MHSKQSLILFFLLLTLPVLMSSRLSPPESLVGRKAPEWKVIRWMNSRPLRLADLEGKVVLVRWWTGPGCPYCSASAPSLNEFYHTYKNQGLVVIGFYHHKSRARLDVGEVKRLADRFGFEFPVAIDPEWRTLKRWYLDRVDSGWTSVSFLLDRSGVIRHIHPGGEYSVGDEDYVVMKSKIEQLLGEQAK